MPMALIKRRIRVWELPVNWAIVFFGNLAGALCYVAFMGELLCLRRRDRLLTPPPAHYSDLYNTEALISYSKTVSVNKTIEGRGPCLLRGIGCNFLVCTAVWLGTSAREVSSKILSIHFPAMLFVFLGFEHVVV